MRFEKLDENAVPCTLLAGSILGMVWCEYLYALAFAESRLLWVILLAPAGAVLGFLATALFMTLTYITVWLTAFGVLVLCIGGPIAAILYGLYQISW